jgi:Ca2+-binding EF-hand superfamily protein
VIAQESMEPNQAEEILSVFREIDDKGLGYISSDDLRKLLDHLDEPLSKQEVDEIISEIDRKNEGIIRFDNFCDVMMPGK